MPDIQIKITNLPQIKAAFSAAPGLMRSEFNTAIRKTVLNIQRKEVSQYRSLGIGIRTRGLISSIERGLYIGELKGEVGPNVSDSPGVPYSVYVHNGTRYQRRKPFLLNAVDSAKLETEGYFKEAVQNALNRIGGMV